MKKLIVYIYLYLIYYKFNKYSLYDSVFPFQSYQINNDKTPYLLYVCHLCLISISIHFFYL